jgi:regulator of RNase E activity RraA
VPISCGGTVVAPGDIVVGDADGVVVVPRGDAEVVLRLVAALMTRESNRIAEIKGGGLFKAEIDDTLRKHGIVE